MFQTLSESASHRDRLVIGMWRCNAQRHRGVYQGPIDIASSFAANSVRLSIIFFFATTEKYRF